MWIFVILQIYYNTTPLEKYININVESKWRKTPKEGYNSCFSFFNQAEEKKKMKICYILLFFCERNKDIDTPSSIIVLFDLNRKNILSGSAIVTIILEMLENELFIKEIC